MDEFRPRAGIDYPRSLGAFRSWFATDAACLDYLDWLRWPDGFVCPRCSQSGGWSLGDGDLLFARFQSQRGGSSLTVSGDPLACEPRGSRFFCHYPCSRSQTLTGPPTEPDGGRNVVAMNNRSEIREFLASRRAKLTPQQVGLPTFGGIRRVPGLRREEVSMLAGVSVEYYTRMERGSLAGASDSVLDSISRALRLNEAEHQHLLNLARTAGPASRTRRQPAKEIDASIQHILDGMVGIPAFVQNGHLDVVAVNDLGRALYSEAYKDQTHQLNYARFVFFNPRSQSLYTDWDQAADTVVAMLHAEAGRDPFDRSLTDLVGELSTRSDEFRRRWAQHDVRHHRSGAKTIRHPAVGDLELNFNALELAATPGLTMFAYSAEPGSSSADGLRLLASWAATNKAAQLHHGVEAEPTVKDALRR